MVWLLWWSHQHYGISRVTRKASVTQAPTHAHTHTHAGGQKPTMSVCIWLQIACNAAGCRYSLLVQLWDCSMKAKQTFATAAFTWFNGTSCLAMSGKKKRRRKSVILPRSGWSPFLHTAAGAVSSSSSWLHARQQETRSTPRLRT